MPGIIAMPGVKSQEEPRVMVAIILTTIRQPLVN
jgi:hypothetical protein